MAKITWKPQTDINKELLAQAKTAKKTELNEICNQIIINGFQYEVNGTLYRFSYDLEAQNNFRDAREAITLGLAQEIEWTAYRVDTGERVRIMVNGQHLKEMMLTQLTHKNTTIAYYNRLLLEKVEPATDVNVVQAIGWE